MLVGMNILSLIFSRAVVAVISISALGFPAFADQTKHSEEVWNCRNNDLEISCPQGECSVADSHTPMSVTASSGELEVCAYSGCWSGVPSASLTSGRFQTFSGVRLLYLADTDDGAHASLTIDTKSGIGTLLVTDYYAQPVTCSSGS